MTKVLKRVPLGFDAPIDKEWEGYSPSIETFQKLFGEEYPFLYEYKDSVEICQKCEANTGYCHSEAPHCFWHNRSNRAKWYKEPPKGRGYQLWDTSIEGDPQSPVFRTLGELCEWCEEHATVFAGAKLSKEDWRRLFSGKDINLLFF